MASNNQEPFKIAVQYFIQNDPCESIKEYNMFFLPNRYLNLNEVKAGDVYSNFPLKEYYTYYLRFFINDPIQKIINSKGWVDFPSKASIPVYDNIVYVKALRIPNGTTILFKSNIYYEKNNQGKKLQHKQSNATKSNQNDDLLVMNDYQVLEFNGNNREFVNKNKDDINNKTPINNNEGKNPQDKQNTESKDDLNLDSFQLLFQQDKIKNTKAFEFIKDTELFNMSNKPKENEQPTDSEFRYYNSNTNTTNYNDKPFEELNLQSPENYYSTLEGIFSDKNPNDQYKKEIFETYSNKRKYSINYISLNMSNDNLHSQIDVIISKWSLSGVSDKKNLICLLSTLNEVWTTDPTFWDNISTEELINNKGKLKTVYKQAMLQFHCDKNTHKDEKTKYLAKCLYQIINEAYVNYNRYL